MTRATHRRLAITLMQMLWDPAESSGWLAGGGGGGGGAGGQGVGGQEGLRRGRKAFLLQTALGDSQVPSVAAGFLGRSLGAVALSPAPRAVFGCPSMPAGWSLLLDRDEVW